MLARKVTRQPQKRDSAKCVGLVPSEAVAKAKTQKHMIAVTSTHLIPKLDISMPECPADMVLSEAGLRSMLAIVKRRARGR